MHGNPMGPNWGTFNCAMLHCAASSSTGIRPLTTSCIPSQFAAETEASRKVNSASCGSGTRQGTLEQAGAGSQQRQKGQGNRGPGPGPGLSQREDGFPPTHRPTAQCRSRQACPTTWVVSFGLDRTQMGPAHSPTAHLPTLRLTKSCFVIALPVLSPRCQCFTVGSQGALVSLFEWHGEAVGWGLESGLGAGGATSTQRAASLLLRATAVSRQDAHPEASLGPSALGCSTYRCSTSRPRSARTTTWAVGLVPRGPPGGDTPRPSLARSRNAALCCAALRVVVAQAQQPER